jgi:hypothetical protein
MICITYLLVHQNKIIVILEQRSGETEYDQAEYTLPRRDFHRHPRRTP